MDGMGAAVTSARVLSVNAGEPRPTAHSAMPTTAVDKRPLDGAVEVGCLGLCADTQVDTRFHGGPHQAVYAYAAEDMAWWGARAGRRFRPGQFAENLTVEGVDVTGSLIGDRWAVGSTVLEVCHVRIPCRTWAAFLGEDRWVRRFIEGGRPGAYLRVLRPGHLAAGDRIDVTRAVGHEVTVGMLFRALTTERDLLPRLLCAPALAPVAREQAESAAGRVE